MTALVLLVGVGCGDDDDGGGLPSGLGSDADGGSNSGGGGGAGSGEPCSLLKVSEIEAAFGDHGDVAEGEPLGMLCTWQVGDIDESGSGAIGVTRARGAGTPEQSITEIRDLALDPVEVEGLGDEAFFDGPILWFRKGDITVSVSAAFFPEVPGSNDKVVELAHKVLPRV